MRHHIKRTLTSVSLALLASACSTAADSGSTTRPGGKADNPEAADIPADVEAAALANLNRVAKEIDGQHLGNYGLSGSLPEQFLAAVKLEYAAQPDQLAARMRALASMIFFSAPDVLPPENGKLTPFHGLDAEQLDALTQIEDAVFTHHMETNAPAPPANDCATHTDQESCWNDSSSCNWAEDPTDATKGTCSYQSYNSGSPEGVRPFAVCETKYIIETYVRPRVAFPGYDAYKAGYEAFAGSCPQADLDEWYNFRGLGGLRPSWVESNMQDRFLRRMAAKCQSPTDEWKAECESWDADRLGYRQRKNTETFAREIYYAAEDESYLVDAGNDLVLVEDRNGDGIGEFLRSGPVTLTSGETATLNVTSTGQFTGQLKLDNGKTVKPNQLVAEDRVDPRYQPGMLSTPDLGLQTVFADSTGCSDDHLAPDTCPLLMRFYSLIDRHENFYQTFSSLNASSANISSQPSPFVACSITLGASRAWDSAGTPAGGTAGFIFLMRIPFNQVLTADRRNIGTLDNMPDVLTLQDIYANGLSLDMSKIWFDIATLSHNQYSSEHEVSKFGNVPAEQIEGIIVVRKPAAMSADQ